MKENHPEFPIPDNNIDSEESVRPGQIFDPQSIPRFSNPLKKVESTTTPHPKFKHINNSVSMKDKLPKKLDNKQIDVINSQPANLTKKDINEKSKTKKRLEKMKKYRHFSTIKFAIISFFVFLVLFNSQLIYSQALYFLSRNTSKQNNSPTVPTQPVTPSNLPNQAAEIVGPENVIIIPKINVNAPLIFIDTTEEKAVLTALQNGVVHYAGTAKPGDNGNAVFFGHSSNDVWEKGNYKFVFVLLEKLSVGDTYEIHYQSRKYVYQVESTAVVAPTDLSVLNQTMLPYSTLITCTPPGTSWKRFIVKAKQIAPAPIQTSTQVASTTPNQSTQSSNAVLPSAAPNLFEQVQSFFTGLISQLFGNNQANPADNPQTNPTNNHLPEVSLKSSITTF